MTDFAKAWNKFQKSDRFKKGSDPETINAPASQRQFLENRLYWAFEAAWEAAQSIGDEK